MQVPLGDTYYFKFTTRQFSSGAPFALAGSPVISVYEENNLTQITAGITLTTDYDSVTGLNDVAIVATSGNGYEAGKYYSAVITTGTVDSVSVVGEVVGQFRVGPAENVAGVQPVDTTHVSGTSQTANDMSGDVNDILVDTNELQGDWANGGRLDNILDARAAEASITALNDVSTADINNQVADVLKTDTIAEMSQGAPPASPTMEQILNYLYRELVRNKVVVDTNTANQKQIFADDGSTILYEKDLTNASNVTTIDEAQTGA